MKLNYLLLFLAMALFVSCSKDKDDNNANSNSIVGIWQVYELKINNDTANNDEKNVRDLLNFLKAKECYVLSFNFKEDMTVIIENSVQYIERSGFDIPCPTEKDTETTVYVYENGTLSYTDESQQIISVDVTISDDLMSVDAADLDIPDLSVGGQLIFKRK